MNGKSPKKGTQRDEALFMPDVIARVLSQPSVEKRSETSVLSERELEVLKAASRGERSKEIALHLGISERTVKAHLDSVYNKLGVDSRAAAVATCLGYLTHP